ncbi:uncharacterized protein LOC143046851 [Mytilus galloprovincialis]|uniref:uncharacterized protein LOC143046851 n=1 Tax=Mytilus galloprovincialis TaxID=29158 RepID=UPI003F7B486F
MTEDAFDLVLKVFGLDKHFKTGPCKVKEGPQDCPVTINPQKYLPASIRTMLQCEMTDNCFGLDCCIDLTFQLPLGDEDVTFHIPFWFKFKPCDFEVDARFGGFTYHKYILDYNWVHFFQKKYFDILDCETAMPADIIFVLDESGNVNQDVFTVSLEAISEATGKLAIGENLIHVGMSMFGGTGTSRTSFDLDTSFERKTVLQSIRETSFNKKENTDIGDALRYVCENMFVSSKGDRGDVKNYVVLMTDGQSNRGSTQTGVNTCRNNGVTIIAVGIGDGISRTELLSVVQDPNHFINTTYENLHSSLEEIIIQSIKCSADVSSFISGWLKQAGMEVLDGVKEGGKQLILKRLGLEDFFSEPKCDKERKPFTPNVGGWNNECPLGILDKPELPDKMACHFKDTCTGIECCIEIPFLDVTLHPFFIIDPCEYTLNYGVNTINETIQLINYEWGKTEKINLAGGVLQLQ